MIYGHCAHFSGSSGEVNTTPQKGPMRNGKTADHRLPVEQRRRVKAAAIRLEQLQSTQHTDKEASHEC